MSHTPPADNGPADARGAAAAALLGPLSFFIEPDDGDADSLEDEESWAPLAARPEWAGFDPGPLDEPRAARRWPRWSTRRGSARRSRTSARWSPPARSARARSR